MLKRTPAKKKGAAVQDVQAKADKAATQRKPSSATNDDLAKGSVSHPPILVASKGIASVREALLAHFRDVFVPSSAFKATFGNRSWSDIQEDVLADIARFGLDAEGDIVRDPNGSATYSGRVWGLYTEVSVQPGAYPSVYVELD